MSVLPHSVLPGTRPLVRDYLERTGGAPACFAHHPADPDAFARAARERLDAYAVDRNVLADKLRAQNTRWRCGTATLANIDKLADSESLAVVTGQQPGILGGPLFTLYKALTAVIRARALEAELRRPCVPVFWLVGDDHDFPEIDHIGVPAESGDGLITYTPREYRAGDSVLAARVEPEPWAAVMARLRELLPETEFSDKAVLGLLNDAYTAGTSLPDAFARLYHRLLADYGIVIVDVTQDGLKELGRGVFAAELDAPGRSTDLARNTGERLREAGYRVQLSFDDANVNLFVRRDGQRLKVRRTDDGFSVGDRPETADGMRRLLDEDVTAFSTGVVLRPVLQDTLLPTVAYVGGPGEVAYFAQLKDVYDAFNVPMPVVCLRDGATLFEPKVSRIVRKLELDEGEYFSDGDELAGRLVRRDRLAGFTQELDALRSGVERHLTTLGDAARHIDPTLDGTVRSTGAKLEKALDVLEKKTVAAAKRKSEELRVKIERLCIHCRPGGTPQERAYTALYYLNLYGPGLVGRIHDAFRDEGPGHHIIHL